MGQVPILGSTPDGADWCLKALHPSDPQTEVRGIPDKSAVPSVFMNFQSTYTVGNPDPAGTSSWEFNGQLVPHPINFLTVGATAVTGGAFTLSSFLNTQIPGSTHAAKYGSWVALAERWRLAYMAVTVYQDAPALANQGTFVAAQHAVEPAFMYCTSNIPGPPIQVTGFPRVSYLDPTSDIPNYTTLQSMPNAYFNRSVEGAYIPLKLTKTCQQWHGTEDQMLFTDKVNLGGATAWGEQIIPNATNNNTWPFIGAERFWTNPAAGTRGGCLTSNYCNDVFATFSARNLGPSTSFSFFVRAGFEIQVQPGTSLTSHQRLSPKHDRQAIDNYFLISRELKDAYPAEFNDKGVILSTIARIANAVSPYLGMVPGVGGILQPIASGVGTAANALDKLLSPSGQQSVNSMAKSMSSSEYGSIQSLADKEKAVARKLKAETAALEAARRRIAAAPAAKRKPRSRKQRKKTPTK